jgi:membrane protein implicated in regulation of membrane protease activity
MPIATDPLSLVFIGCFLFGMLFLIVTALLGNLGHGAAHGITHQGPVHVAGHVGATHVVTTHTVSHGPIHAVAHGQAHTTGQATGGISSILPYVNLTSIIFFLIGFGLFGYLFHNVVQVVALFALVLAGVSGIVLAVLLLLLLSRLFGDSEGETVQDVSDRTGIVGKVSMTIQENSLGEVIYTSPGGMRKSIPARSVDGRRLDRDQEVVIVNYQHGIAEVDTWDHFIGEEESQLSAPTSATPDSDELATLRALLDEPAKTDTEMAMRKDLQKE